MFLGHLKPKYVRPLAGRKFEVFFVVSFISANLEQTQNEINKLIFF